MADFTRSTPLQWATSRHEAGNFDFIVRVHRDRVRIELFGELDGGTAPMLRRRIAGLLGRFEHLELDLTHLEFLGAAGLCMIFEAANAVGPRGTMALLFPSSCVLRTLHAVSLPAHVCIETTDPAAGRSRTGARSVIAFAPA